MSFTVDGKHASVKGGAALSPIKGNVTAGEPKCRTGNLGGVPKYTLEVAMETLLPFFICSKI